MPPPADGSSPTAPQPGPRRHHKWKGGEVVDATTAWATARNQRLFGLAFLLLIVLAAIIGVLSLVDWTPPRTTFLSLTIPAYNVPKPPLPFAAVDSAGLEDCFGEAKHTIKKAEADTNKNRFQARLAELANENTTDTLVVFLCAHARAEGDDVLILTAEADRDLTIGVSFKEVLETIRKCKAKHKLLIVDLMRPVADLRLGFVPDDLARKLEKLCQPRQPKDPAILLACSPGELSAPAEEVGHSAFGYYLIKGLRGAAEGFGTTGRREGTVRMRELAAYVRNRVSQWAVTTGREHTQTPRLIAEDNLADFDLIKVPADAGSEPYAGRTAPKDYPEADWKKVDEFRSRDALSVAPRAFGHARTWLQNGEQRWRFGEPLADIRSRDLARAIPAAQTHLDSELRQIPSEPPNSLAQVLKGASPPKGFDDFKRALKLLAEREALKKLDPAVPFKFEEALEKQWKEIDKEGRAWVARAILEAVLDDTTLGRDRFRVYWNVVETTQLLPEVDRWVELLALARLNEQARSLNIDNLPREEQVAADQGWGKRAQKVLSLELAAEKTAAMPQRATPWLSLTMRQALAARAESLYLAFSPRFVSGSQAEQALDQALKLESRWEESFRSLNRAFDAYDQALAYLPAFAEFLFVLPPSTNLGGNLTSEYRAALRALSDVSAVLATTPRASGEADLAAAADSLIRAGRTLDERLSELRDATTGAALKDRINQIQRDGQGQGDAVLTAWLKLPWLTPAERKSLWDAKLALGETLRKRIEAQDQTDAEGNRSAISDPARPPRDYPFGDEARRAADLQMGLLSLAPQPEIAAQNLRPLLEATSPDPASIGKELRAAWSRVADQAGKESTSETLARLAFQEADGFELPANSAMPAARHRGEEAKAHRRLLGSYARVVKEDFRFDRLTREFYDGLAARLGAGDVNLPTGFDAPDVRLNLQTTQDWALRFRWSGESTKPPPQVELIRNSQRPFFSLEPATPPAQEEERGRYRVAALVRRADLLPRGAPPEGFIARITTDGWSQHQRVRVTLPEATVTPPSLLVSAKPLTSAVAETAVSLETLALRPNQPQEFRIYIFNPGEVEKKLYVELLSDGRELARSGEIAISKDQKLVEVQLTRPTMVKFQDLPGEVLELRLRDSTGTRAEVQLAKLKLRVMEPAEYIIVENAVYDVADRSMKISTRLRDTVTGPECPLEIQLPREFLDYNQGLEPDPEGGVRRGKLKPGERKVLELAQRVRTPRRQTSIEAMVFVKVDEVPRALAFRTEVPRADSGQREMRMDLFRERWLGMANLPEYAQPTVQKKALRLECLNLSPKQVVRVTWDRREHGEFRSELTRLSGPRQVGFQWTVGETNLLTLIGNVTDWEMDLDLSPIGGTAFVRAEAYEGPDLRDEVFKTAPQRIVMDDTEPSRPRRVGSARLVGNQLEIRYRTTDPESGIEEVKLFLGEYLGEESLPKQGARKARDVGNGEWSVTIPVQPNEPTVPVTIVATNRVKLSSLVNDVIDVDDLRRQAAEQLLASVRGTVRSLSGTTEPGVTVELWQGGKATKFSAVTNANGVFVIKGVPPGSYILRGTKSAGNLSGQTDAFTLQAGQELERSFTVR